MPLRGLYGDSSGRLVKLKILLLGHLVKGQTQLELVDLVHKEQHGSNGDRPLREALVSHEKLSSTRERRHRSHKQERTEPGGVLLRIASSLLLLQLANYKRGPARQTNVQDRILDVLSASFDHLVEGVPAEQVN